MSKTELGAAEKQSHRIGEHTETYLLILQYWETGIANLGETSVGREGQREHVERERR
jgi:hypothetical protein